MPHLDTLGPFVGWLIKECRFPPQRVAEILSAGPARILAPDLPLKHGVIEESRSASFTALDMNGTTLPQEGDQEQRSPKNALRVVAVRRNGISGIRAGLYYPRQTVYVPSELTAEVLCNEFQRQRHHIDE